MGIICVIYSQLCPAAPRGFCQFLRGGVRLAFRGAGQPVFTRGGTGWGGPGRTSLLKIFTQTFIREYFRLQDRIKHSKTNERCKKKENKNFLFLFCTFPLAKLILKKSKAHQWVGNLVTCAWYFFHMMDLIFLVFFYSLKVESHLAQRRFCYNIPVLRPSGCLRQVPHMATFLPGGDERGIA